MNLLIFLSIITCSGSIDDLQSLDGKTLADVSQKMIELGISKQFVDGYNEINEHINITVKSYDFNKEERLLTIEFSKNDSIIVCTINDKKEINYQYFYNIRDSFLIEILPLKFCGFDGISVKTVAGAGTGFLLKSNKYWILNRKNDLLFFETPAYIFTDVSDQVKSVSLKLIEIQCKILDNKRMYKSIYLLQIHEEEVCISFELKSSWLYEQELKKNGNYCSLKKWGFKPRQLIDNKDYENILIELFEAH